jgi:hypothetical protein
MRPGSGARRAASARTLLNLFGAGATGTLVEFLDETLSFARATVAPRRIRESQDGFVMKSEFHYDHGQS